MIWENFMCSFLRFTCLALPTQNFKWWKRTNLPLSGCKTTTKRKCPDIFPIHILYCGCFRLLFFLVKSCFSQIRVSFLKDRGVFAQFYSYSDFNNMLRHKRNQFRRAIINVSISLRCVKGRVLPFPLCQCSSSRNRNTMVLS